LKKKKEEKESLKNIDGLFFSDGGVIPCWSGAYF